MDRLGIWLAVSPISAAGVLIGHALGYRLSGTPSEPFHAYLDHAPQLLFVLAVVSAVAAVVASRAAALALWPFPAAALATFVAQEHVERLAHSGELPWLLTSQAFLLGLLLQVPIALVVWALSGRLLETLAVLSERRPKLPRLLLDVVTPATVDVRPAPAAPQPGRGPPSLPSP